MDFEWRDFLEFSKKLAKEDDAASARSAVSRAYYAAFHYAEDFGKAWLTPVKCDGVHKATIETLETSLDRGIINTAKSLRKLRDYRVDADYHPESDINKKIAEASIIMSEEIIENLEQMGRKKRYPFKL